MLEENNAIRTLGRGVPPAEAVVSGNIKVTDVILSKQRH